MPPNLKNEARVWRLAADLGLKQIDNPVSAVVHFCLKRVRLFLREHPRATLAELLDLVAVKLDVLFIEVHDDEQLRRIRDDYFRRGETSFADLQDQLAPNVYAITFRLMAPSPGDRRFVALIDCRGSKRFRSYFSKWHEMAHLLTLTPQMRLKFCRTHVLPENKDPEEALMDVIAGEFAFFSELVREHAIGPISFSRIEALRVSICPEASQKSAIIGLAKAWPQPCILIQAGLGLKKDERAARNQLGLEFREPPRAVLRALHASSNEAAKTAGMAIPPNMRVPDRSVIFQAFRERGGPWEAEEDLDWWESQGRRLRSQPVLAQAWSRGDRVDALITPRTPRM